MPEVHADLPTQIEAIGHALTCAELGRLLNVHRATIFRWAATGVLPSFRIGGTVRLDCRAVARFLRERAI